MENMTQKQANDLCNMVNGVKSKPISITEKKAQLLINEFSDSDLTYDEMLYFLNIVSNRVLLLKELKELDEKY